MTSTPWILTEVHRNPDCLEWIISTERPAGATEGCKANPRIAIFDEMGGSGAGRCEGRHNALVLGASVSWPRCLIGIVQASGMARGARLQIRV